MDQALIRRNDVTDDYLHSRANAMQNIESTIVELGGIFSQLAHMIKEQVTILTHTYTAVISLSIVHSCQSVDFMYKLVFHAPTRSQKCTSMKNTS
jgi:hypothetical protein